ncbi:MAG: helix-turn-helix transcriptional regulator [Saccharofermentans sp.]|nr:helix-turn-helix transcriptional regulator [Saccharofermentans sp.]
MGDKLEEVNNKLKEVENSSSIDNVDRKLEEALKRQLKYNQQDFGKRITDRREELSKIYEEHETEPNNPYRRYQFCTSQSRIGELLDCNRRTVGNWEAGTSVPDLQQAYGLALILDMRLDHLLGFQELDNKYREMYDVSATDTAHLLTGINKDILAKIMLDKDIGYLNILNAFMHPKNCSYMLGLISNVDLIRSFQKTELTHIKEPLKTSIIQAYDMYRATYGMERCTLEGFTESLSEYLNPGIVNLSARKKEKTILVKTCIEKQIREQIKFSDYESFIASLANYSYERLRNMEQYKTYKHLLIEQFSSFVDAYIEGKYEGSTIEELLPT